MTEEHKDTFRDIGMLIAILTFLIQLFVIVWGAAKIDAAVESLKIASEDLSDNLKSITNTVNEHSKVLVLLNEKINNVPRQ